MLYASLLNDSVVKSGAGNATYDWRFVSTPQVHAGGRNLSLPRCVRVTLPQDQNLDINPALGASWLGGRAGLMDWHGTEGRRRNTMRGRTWLAIPAGVGRDCFRL